MSVNLKANFIKKASYKKKKERKEKRKKERGEKEKNRGRNLYSQRITKKKMKMKRSMNPENDGSLGKQA